MKLETNQRVRIEVEGIGVSIGRVEDVRQVEDMPDIPGVRSREAKAIMREWHVTNVAMLSYHATPATQFLFCAIEIGGEWYDLKRQRLQLQIIGRVS